MKLHYSQTNQRFFQTAQSFITLWNYTILKLRRYNSTSETGFITLWNYTILKQSALKPTSSTGFITLWNYTILKPQI